MFLQNDDGFLFPHCYHYFRFRCYSVEVNFFGLVALVDYFQRTMIGEDYLTIFDLAKKIQKSREHKKVLAAIFFFLWIFSENSVTLITFRWHRIVRTFNIWVKKISTLCTIYYVYLITRGVTGWYLVEKSISFMFFILNIYFTLVLQIVNQKICCVEFF